RRPGRVQGKQSRPASHPQPPVNRRLAAEPAREGVDPRFSPTVRHPGVGRVGQCLLSSLAHKEDVLVSATLQTLRTDRVASLFRPSQPTLAAERALEAQIGALVTNLLRAKHVAEPVDLAALVETFADSELPEEPVTPCQYVEHLAANVVPYSNRIASPRSL